MTDGRDDAVLIEALSIAQRLGVIGDTDLVTEIRHARWYVSALDRLESGSTVLDLGSGGGLPGLVIAHDRPDFDVTLIDRRQKRTDILQRQVGHLRSGRSGLEVKVLCADISEHVPLGVEFHAVTARSFASPAVTARTAAAHLVSGGLLVVSNPPRGSASTRWSHDVLVGTGLELDTSSENAKVSVLIRE